MQIFIVIKVATEKSGDRVWATTEKAFKEVDQAQTYMKSVPSVWDELVDGTECNCERAVHPAILE
jgi:hypothetical protein